MPSKQPIREGLYREDAGRPVLIGSRCRHCGRTHFPSVTVCLDCSATSLEEMDLPREGTLFSYTIIGMPGVHFAPGHIVGYIQLLEGLRVFAPLAAVDGSALAVGQRFELEITSLWQDETGREVTGYRFVPSTGAAGAENPHA
jgi:uncharacterized OB-fold protein